MPAADLAPTVDAPMEDAVPVPRFNRRMVLGGGGALAASVAAAYLIGLERYRTLESGVGEIRHIALKDGTMLTLDTDSRVDVALSSNERKLSLVRGKAFLDVTRWQKNPVIIQAGSLLLQMAKGAFGLQNLVDMPVVALVTEGRLLISQSPSFFGRERKLTLEKDHALTLASDANLQASEVRSVAPPQQEQFLAWREGMLSFGGELLADAVRAFDRYGSARIVVADPDLAKQRITGLFKANDPRGFAVAVAASFGGSVTSQGDVIRISGKKLQSA
ncbi:hypothetical protein M527_11595 [Sphingobium indicum IP26]|nr:anti-sigma factor [Sphingobium indicum B90A]EPR18805.1 hypothetical protein M527_11595 [Sphingobium indicum IP26]EQB01026.1 hypothetical protein L286_16625 [Sphingobium sp. HDIP04]